MLKRCFHANYMSWEAHTSYCPTVRMKAGPAPAGMLLVGACNAMGRFVTDLCTEREGCFCDGAASQEEMWGEWAAHTEGTSERGGYALNGQV